MTAFFKRYFIIIIASVITCIVIIAAGISAVDRTAAAESKQSSYKLTAFDYVIQAPSREQVAELKRTDGVAGVFACRGFDMSLRGVKLAAMDFVFMPESLDGYEIGLFSPDTCLKGGADPNGVMLDERAAERLGVDVGDKITFTLAAYPYTKTVSGIYMASTYRDMDKNGVAMIVGTEDMIAKFKRNVPFTHAFIDASDETKCAAALAGYIPYGRMQTQDDYIAEYKAANSKPASLTDDEWTASIVLAYNEYKAKFEAVDYPEAVQYKANYMDDVADRVESTLSGAKSLAAGIAAGSAVIMSLAGVLSIILNRKNDVLRRSYGEEKSKVLTGYIAVHTVCAVAVAVLSLAALCIKGLLTRYLGVCLGVIFTCSLPALASVIPVAVAAVLYVNKLYAAARKARTPLGSLDYARDDNITAENSDSEEVINE